MLMSAAEIASIIKARCPEYLEDRGAVGLWLSIVVAFSVRLYPTDTEARLAWAATCGWHVERVRGPTPLREVILRTLKEGGPG